MNIISVFLGMKQFTLVDSAGTLHPDLVILRDLQFIIIIIIIIIILYCAVSVIGLLAVDSAH